MLARRTFLFASLGVLAAEAVIPLGDAASYYVGAEWDKPFLYPLRTVSGKNLSRRYPLEKLAGEQTDHAWHRGLWWGHGIINGLDFWRELGREKTARLVLDGAVKAKGRKVEASFAMVGPDGKRVGTHRQSFAIRDKGAVRTIDAVLAVSADQGQALTFGDTDDGGFGFRLADAFREDRGARLRNSEGQEGTKAIWGKAARWVDYAAVVEGSAVGVAVFDHPSNLRHPTAWHARGYSLNAANPFAGKSFNKGQGPDGAYTLAAGAVLTLRYRVVIHEGPFEPERIEREYRAWAGR
jgi:hypothetical protein